MSLRNKIITTAAMALAVGAFSTFSAAQTAPQSSDSDVQRKERGEGRRGGFGRGMRGDKRGGGKFALRGLRGLNLTDAQKEQVRTIMEANKATNQTSHEEMKTLAQARRNGELTAEQQDRLKSLRDQAKQNMDAVQAQILAILTPEQRAQLDQQKQEMQKRREERRQMKGNRQTTDNSQIN